MGNTKNDKVIKSFMEHSKIPIINMESNVYHPCQGLGDAIQLKKNWERLRVKYVLTWAYHPRHLPMATANSEILSACDLGMDVVVSHPQGWELDPQIIQSMSQVKKSGVHSASVTQWKKHLKIAMLFVLKLGSP